MHCNSDKNDWKSDIQKNAFLMKMYWGNKMNLCIALICLLLSVPEILCYDIPKDVLGDHKFTYQPDIYRNVSELIVSKGYHLEEHIVETSDGFLLSVQRIPFGRSSSIGKKNRPAVLLVHGLLSAASDFVLNFPGESLAFILPDIGYDVWLANTRGNCYSRHHKTLKPNMSQFWDFSFDQMGEYDLPALIDYVLNKTEEKQLFYVGHSQGTTAAFALLSERPDYNKKIKLLVALGPVATVGYIRNMIRYLSPLIIDIDWFLKYAGVNEFLPRSELLEYLSDKVCDSKVFKYMCDKVLYLVYGWDQRQMNETRLPVYLSHYPSGSSTKSILHYAQMVESKKFQKFDYGKHNMDFYNQTTPPEYNVTKITTPIALFWAVGDNMADFIDVSLLQRKLNSLVISYCVPNEEFNHGEFVYGINAPKLVYKEVLSLMKKYI